MNNIKRELKEVLEDKTHFTQKNENYVLQQIMQPKKKSWTTLFIAASFVTLLALFVGASLWQQTNESKAQFTHFFESYMGGRNYEVIFQEFNYLKEGDALVAFIERNEGGKIYLAYLEYKNGWQWIQTTGTQSKPYDGKEFWGSTVQEPFMYAGVMETAEIKQIIVGEQKATLIPLTDGLTYWFAISDKAARIIVQNKDNTWERLAGDLYSRIDEIEHIPLINSLSGEQYAIQLTSNTMEQGKQEYTQYPIVVDPQFDQLDRLDVILYTAKDGQQVMSRVLGLPNETIEIINGSVVINTIPIPYHAMFAKIMGETVYENYIEKFEDTENAQEIFFFNHAITQLSEKEIFVIPDNWSLDKIEAISLEQVDAKVIGYESKDIEKEWTEQERSLYTAFKNSNDIEVFRNVDPITYARVQLYAQFLVDKRTAYRMYTTEPGHVQWTEEEHIRQNNSFSHLENERRYASYYAQLLLAGEFQIHNDEGIITFHLPSGDIGMWRMIQNKNGIWQSGFLPLQ
ncbi:S26 family signal peptidase [Metasolibacillus meyeri]|uniref:S26 family signal peptidase n=1 Tax=Metasolibacillus meyeri TaxID=1071052 RepID=A0AAW9NRB3_9BACL|nr:S26 family signal peptidase [Metasolibacillus meyeri]MEC1179016.1 S26 family signal peptidase [Metasolibacillus meyeri]